MVTFELRDDKILVTISVDGFTLRKEIRRSEVSEDDWQKLVLLASI